ncbi:MAG: helix-turn-helix domain-containing protein, partial [Blautia caecimuris]
LDIVAEVYNIILFTMDTGTESYDISEAYSECEAQRRERMEAFFVDNANAMLFRNNAFSYGVLVKEQRNAPLENTEKCVEFFKGIMEGAREQDWFLAVGQPVERLSSIKLSYHTASKAFARRYLYDGSVLYYGNLEQEETKKDDSRFLKKIDINALNPATLERFLGSGLLDETEDFVRDYFQAIGHEAMESLVFRNYVILNVRFSVLGFLQKLGCEPGRLEGQDTEQELMERAQSMETAQKYAQDIIRNAIMLRDENSGNRNRSILKSAIEYIDTHYVDESLSLNTAAQVANISANHFSALFSQNMGQTFIEYLTALRMEHARELLRCTGKRSSEIAAEVGYKDAHYFSYLFKKTQGMTPSEYRKTREDRG